MSTVKEGYLTKLKMGLKRNQKRYFVLAKDKLAYYDSNKKSEEIGWMPVSSISALEYHESDMVIRFTSSCSHVAKKKNETEKSNHLYVLKAESISECGSWYDALKQESCKKMMVLPATVDVMGMMAAASIDDDEGEQKKEENTVQQQQKQHAHDHTKEKGHDDDDETRHDHVHLPSPEQLSAATSVHTVHTDIRRPSHQHKHNPDIDAASKAIFKKYTSKETPDILHADQLQRICADYGYWMKPEELAHALSILDTEKRGIVKMHTFLDWWAHDNRFDMLRVSPEQLERLQHMSQYFFFFDRDSNGTLDTDEFTYLHKDLIRNGYKIGDVKTCIQELDINKDNLISFNEFVLWMETGNVSCQHDNHNNDEQEEEDEDTKRHRMLTAPVIHKPKCASRLIFDKFDVDSSGTISASELRNLCFQHGYCLTDEELAAALCKIDLDSSGSIDFDEFSKWWKSEHRFETLHVSEPEMLALERLSEYFARFADVNSGEIDQEAFNRLHADLVAHGYHMPPPEEALHTLDSDKSGTVSYNEFVQWMLKIGALHLHRH